MQLPTNKSIKAICEEVASLLNTTDKELKYLSRVLITSIEMLIQPGSFTSDDLTHLLNLTKKTIGLKQERFMHPEEELLKIIWYLPHQLWEDEAAKEGFTKFSRTDNSEAAKIANSIIEFVLAIYQTKIPRASFAGQRRAYVVQTLESLSHYFLVPEFIETCAISLKNKSKIEFIATTESLNDYWRNNLEKPEQTMIALIEKRIDKTKQYGELISGLRALIGGNAIGELTAMDITDEWKEKNNYW